MKQFGKNSEQPSNQTRINYQIRVPRVRVIDADNEQLGVMTSDNARSLARESGLDLVEIVPNASPPVCRIMDYGKFRYEQNQKDKDKKKKQRESREQLKELRLRPGIGDHDIDTKVNHARDFLSEGKKVQFNLIFKGRRELAHKEQGFDVISRVVQDLQEISVVERPPKIEGNRVTCRLAPIK